MAQGRYAEAEEILHRAAVRSHVEMPAVILNVPPQAKEETDEKSLVQKLCNEDNRRNLLLLLRSSMMRKHAMVMCFVW